MIFLNFSGLLHGFLARARPSSFLCDFVESWGCLLFLFCFRFRHNRSLRLDNDLKIVEHQAILAQNEITVP
jgi:hypothetical protein